MRTKEEILFELNEIQQFLLKGIPDSDITAMLTSMSTLVTYLASSAALVAESGVLYNKAKVKAYYALESRYKDVGRKMTPSLAKDYISGELAEENYAYEMAQRINAATTHTIEAIRTSISAEKSLNQSMSYPQTR